jgi:hypothetical protein
VIGDDDVAGFSVICALDRTGISRLRDLVCEGIVRRLLI